MDSPKKKNQTPIHSKSLNQIRNFGPYCPLQPAVDDRRSDFSKSVHSGTKTLSPFLLTQTVVFSFLLLRFLWVDEVFFYLVKAFIAQKITLIKSIFSPTVYHYTNLCFGRKYTMYQCKKRPNEYTESLGEKQTVGPKRPSRIESSNITAGIAEWYGQKMLIRPRSEHRIGRGKEGP